MQLPVPEHAPVHPEKTEPLAEAAVSETDVPELADIEHVDPQKIPLPETVPVPVPLFETDKAYVVGVVLRSPT